LRKPSEGQNHKILWLDPDFAGVNTQANKIRIRERAEILQSPKRRSWGGTPGALKEGKERK